nr:MAG TPA: hypothetical protein [Caudoviricetes sp.]
MRILSIKHTYLFLLISIIICNETYHNLYLV